MANAKNTAAVAFAAATAAGADATTVSVYDALAAGNELWAQDVTGDPAALALGGRYNIAAEALTIPSETGGSSTAKGKVEQLKGLLAGTRYIGLKDGSGELSGGGYARVAIALAGWTITE